MESLELHFNWYTYFQQSLHALSLFFSNIGRCNRFIKICIQQNDRIKEPRSSFGFGLCRVSFEVLCRDLFELVLPGYQTKLQNLSSGPKTQRKLYIHVSVNMPAAVQPALAICVSRFSLSLLWAVEAYRLESIHLREQLWFALQLLLVIKFTSLSSHFTMQPMLV